MNGFSWLMLVAVAMLFCTTINTSIPAIQQGIKRHRAQFFFRHSGHSVVLALSIYPTEYRFILVGGKKKCNYLKLVHQTGNLYTAHMQTQYPDRHVQLTRRSFFVFFGID